MFAVAGLQGLPNGGANGTGAAGPNQRLAERYGIIFGTSHHEPMARNMPEWYRYGKGAWDFVENQQTLLSFWHYGAERAAPQETMYTVGMRGDGDKPLKGASTALLEKIVATQRDILSKTLEKSAREIPQAWCMYSEVMAYYEQDGLQVPDDVTLLWADDNFGNLRRVPTAGAERTRSGGHGLYYHMDYHGGPRSYQWLSTINFIKTWEQVHVAQTTGIDRIFIVNIGDLKPIEVALEYALNLAYHGTESAPVEALQATTSSADVTPWMEKWALRTFPSLPNKNIANIVLGYNALNSKKKPELVNASTWSIYELGEAERVEAGWQSIISTVQKLKTQVAPGDLAAFEELVAIPAQISANLNHLYVAVARANLYADQGRSSTKLWHDRAFRYFSNDASLTETYHSLLGRKWDL